MTSTHPHTASATCPVDARIARENRAFRALCALTVVVFLGAVLVAILYGQPV